MERIVHTLRESCSIAVLDGRDAVYVARVAAKRIMSINLVVGSRLPAHATSMGKVLLAHLPAAQLDEFFAAGPLRRLTSRTIVDEAGLRHALDQVRARGWAFADQESEDGVRTVAVPLFDRNMKVEAAMNVSGHASRVPMKELRSRYLPVLMEAATEISRALGANVPTKPARRS
jgi:IclR family pca regulon transcriptional regulator